MELEAGTNKKGKDTGDEAGTTTDSNCDEDADLGESNYDAKPKKGTPEEDLIPVVPCGSTIARMIDVCNIINLRMVPENGSHYMFGIGSDGLL